MNLEIVFSGIISGVIGIIGTYFILKKVSNDIIFDLKDELLDVKNFQNNEDLQKFFYMIGGFIGKGARSGIGMDRKLKPQDLFMSLAARWIENKMPRNQSGRSITPTTDNSNDPFKV